MVQQKSRKLHRFLDSFRDWKGTDIPIGSVGIYILVRPSGNGKGGIRLSFSTMQKP